MFTYNIEKDISNPEFLSLSKKYIKKQYKFMKKLVDTQRMTFFVVARKNNKVVGTMGVMINVDEITYMFFHVVVHPKYRSNFICNSIRYMGIKFAIEDRAKIIEFMKVDNQCSHQRFIDIGFKKLSSTYNKKGERFTHYRQDSNCLDKEKLKYIWKTIESGNQHTLMEI